MTFTENEMHDWDVEYGPMDLKTVYLTNMKLFRTIDEEFKSPSLSSGHIVGCRISRQVQF